MTNILVLDGNQRSALAVVRSLGELDVDIITSDETNKSLAGHSKFVKRNIQSPSPKEEPDDFIEWFNNTVESEQISIAFPVTEITSQLLLLNKEKLSHKVKLPFADIDIIMQLANKSNLMKRAEKLNVKHPKTEYFEHQNQLDMNAVKEYPCVIKPSLSRIFIESEWIDSEVKIIYSKEDLEHLLESNYDYLNYPFMLQEFIPGKGAGIFTIYHHGKEIAFFAHKRLREKPPSGGVSVLSESAELNPEMLESARKILDDVNWHGVAMVEYRVSDDGIPYLMEVNTRFWGSLQLAIDSGVNFPKILYRITNNEKVDALNNYKIGQQLRWFLGDLDSLYIVLKDGRYGLTAKLKRIVTFLVPKLMNRRMEVNRFGDLSPAIYEIKTYFKSLMG